MMVERSGLCRYDDKRRGVFIMRARTFDRAGSDARQIAENLGLAADAGRRAVCKDLGWADVH